MSEKLIFDEENYTIEELTCGGRAVKTRIWRDIVYVSKPVDPVHQRLCVYAPEAYYEGQSMNGHSLHTAPIFFPNDVGGFMPALPIVPGMSRMPGGGVNAAFLALERGFVVISPGARGRGVKDADGKNIGIAPAAIVDLKSAVRYIKSNRGRIPGDADRIISNGTSAGGALSALLGSTGSHPDYEPYLRALGAADAPDDVFAASCYCPITDLDHADMAYEWEFCGQDEYFPMAMPGTTAPRHTQTPAQQAASAALAKDFPAYVNGLGLRGGSGVSLTLEENGSGSFREHVLKCVADSAQRALDEGSDLSGLDWLTIEDGKVTRVDFGGLVRFRTRMKPAPAFDRLEPSEAPMGDSENELFASPDAGFGHFTAYGAGHGTAAPMADPGVVRRMNPLNYIGDGRAASARYFRIRHGVIDRHTSLAVSVILSEKLRMAGIDVDLFHPWDTDHGGDYDADELFDWIERICAEKGGA